MSDTIASPYLALDLLEWVETGAQRSGRTKNQIIVAAADEYLARIQ